MTSTSPATDNGRTVASMYEAFGRGDVAYVLAQMAPDVEWIETEAANIPTHGTFASPQATGPLATQPTSGHSYPEAIERPAQRA
jgi:ketosteroid isomerase-like protein